MYSIHRYTDEIYKVVAFKGHRDPDFACLREEAQHYDTKLDNSFSRARSMVLQYALCNPWDYFFTGTLDQRLADRYNLDRYAKRLMQFIRDKRKKYNASFQVLLVPELHQDGAWHIHGLIYSLPASALRPFRYPEPQKLIDGGFLNWPDYQRAFGFCSLAPIRDRVATAYYVTKYIIEDACAFLLECSGNQLNNSSSFCWSVPSLAYGSASNCRKLCLMSFVSSLKPRMYESAM